MQLNFEIKEFVRKTDCQWTIRTVSIPGFTRPIKVEYAWRMAGREIEDVKTDVIKQVVGWLRDGTPITGGSDWTLKTIWTTIL